MCCIHHRCSYLKGVLEPCDQNSIFYFVKVSHSSGTSNQQPFGSRRDRSLRYRVTCVHVGIILLWFPSIVTW
ncbi:hypothetical protein BDR03DRAFT_956713 [Suillus americanus]|nr:hypothetical protein BDR03DRAFT_956713 [Suillus americanus]